MDKVKLITILLYLTFLLHGTNGAVMPIWDIDLYSRNIVNETNKHNDEGNRKDQNATSKAVEFSEEQHVNSPVWDIDLYERSLNATKQFEGIIVVNSAATNESKEVAFDQEQYSPVWDIDLYWRELNNIAKDHNPSSSSKIYLSNTVYITLLWYFIGK